MIDEVGFNQRYDACKKMCIVPNIIMKVDDKNKEVVVTFRQQDMKTAVGFYE